jgi:hypothetical protein
LIKIVWKNLGSGFYLNNYKSLFNLAIDNFKKSVRFRRKSKKTTLDEFKGTNIALFVIKIFWINNV